MARISRASRLAVARLGLGTASRFRLLAKYRSGVQFWTRATQVARSIKSRWPELNWRPTPSLIPLLQLYKRARLYLSLSSFIRKRDPCQSFGLNQNWFATVSALQRLLTVIEDSYKRYHLYGQTLRVTMGLLYQLSYIGICYFQEQANDTMLNASFQSDLYTK